MLTARRNPANAIAASEEPTSRPKRVAGISNQKGVSQPSGPDSAKYVPKTLGDYSWAKVAAPRRLSFRVPYPPKAGPKSEVSIPGRRPVPELFDTLSTHASFVGK